MSMLISLFLGKVKEIIPPQQERFPIETIIISIFSNSPKIKLWYWSELWSSSCPLYNVYRCSKGYVQNGYYNIAFGMNDPYLIQVWSLTGIELYVCNVLLLIIYWWI